MKVPLLDFFELDLLLLMSAISVSGGTLGGALESMFK